MKKLLRSAFTIICLLILLWLFISCRSLKSAKENMQQTGTVQLQNDIEAIRVQDLRAEIDKIIYKALSEQMNISHKETEYDSDKPIDAGTGKPPVKKEKETIFHKKTDENTKTEGHTVIARQDSGLIGDKSKSENIYNHLRKSESEVNKQRESDIFLKWAGGIAISVVILCLFLYIFRKRLKNWLHNLL